MNDLHRIAATAARLQGATAKPNGTTAEQLFEGLADTLANVLRNPKLIEACARRAQLLADALPMSSPAPTDGTPHSAS